MANSSSLDALLGSGAAKRFLRDCWPDEHVLVHRKSSQLPACFREGPLCSFDSLAAVYGGRVQIAGGRGTDHLQFSVSEAPAAYLRRIGLTVFFGDDVSALAPGGVEFLRGLERDLGAPRGIGAIRMFASPSGGGLEAHYDQGETFLVQLSGKKRIWLAKNTTWPTLQFTPGKPPAEGHYPEFTQRGFPLTPPKNGFTVTMKPGSVLFIPRGMWHRTEAGTASFSASVCVDIPNAIDVLLPQLRAAMKELPELRRPLFGAWGGSRNDSLRRVAATLRTLASSLTSVEPELVLDSVGEKSAEELPLRDGTRFQRIPSTRVEVRRNELRVTTYDDARVVRISLSKALRAPARWLSRRGPAFTFGELASLHPSTPPEELGALIRSLVESEGVRWLPFPTLRERS
ncbi:MAG: JmjC domain-containing protein [Myxococcaceae bacterium]